MELHILNSRQNRSKNKLVVKMWREYMEVDRSELWALAMREKRTWRTLKRDGDGDPPPPPIFSALLKGNGEDGYAGYTCIIHTYGSKTSLEMYSFGILGSWYENTFCNPTNQRSVCFEGCLLNELPTTWNSITPLLSSQRAASSLALWVPGYSPPWNS